MNRIMGPTGALLVGATFVCLCLVLGASATEQRLNLIHPQFESDAGQLKLPNNNTHIFPWASRRPQVSFTHRRDFILHAAPLEEKIRLNKSDSDHQVQDLKAMNSLLQRDISYDELQNGDPEAQGLANFLDIRVTGKEHSEKEFSIVDEGEDIEKIVDDKLNSCMNDNRTQAKGPQRPLQRLANSMNIDVSGITVSAINTVEGGSAVATSNIIIKPVQIIVCSPEVEEKLK